jgi:CubicO group peptidase (beta-lactamase class C family)
LAKALQPYVDSHSLAGAVVLVADKDKVLDLEAVGYADIAASKPMQTDSVFWIASMTKSMTAAALMMLVEEGKVNLNDPVAKYIPEFRDQKLLDPNDPAHALKSPSHLPTVRELLSHTSGLPFHTKVKMVAGDAISLQDAVKVFASEPLQFDPGTSYFYSNEGFITLGRIIEVASGVPYGQFMQTRLLGPLGMTETRFVPTTEELTRLAKVYQTNKDKTGLEEIDGLKSGFTYPLDNPKRIAFPAGGLFSTATDVSKFCQMFLNGGTYKGKRYLSEASLKEMTTRQSPLTVKDDYGLGWGLGPRGEYFHAGGYKTYMEINPGTGRILIFMVQMASHEWPNDGGTIMSSLKRAAATLPLPADQTQ